MTTGKTAFSRGVSRRSFLGASALMGLGVASGGSLLASCGAGVDGSGESGSAEDGGSVTWASWANPGESERFEQFSKNYTAKYGVQVTWQQVVGDYQSKLLTQLAGGVAPDAFYVGDTSMAPLIASGKLQALDDFLASDRSEINIDKVYEGLYQWCKSDDGTLYGVPVDCNPKVFWFNAGLLAEAGVTPDPTTAFGAGTWDRAALDDMLTKVKATGKRGMVVEANWFDLFSLITTFGGTAVADGEAVFDTDPKAMETIEWLFDHFKAGTITYGGTLSQGQGVAALFYAGQLASVQYGRWILPNLLKLKGLQYDIAPMPSEDGKTVMPVAVYTAAMSVNTGAKNRDAALVFLSRYCNADGQRARLSGGGNAVPSMAGLDEIVLEGGQPANAQYFTQVAAKAYAVPDVIARSATVGTNFAPTMDKIIKGGASGKQFAKKMAAFINAGG